MISRFSARWRRDIQLFLNRSQSGKSRPCMTSTAGTAANLRLFRPFRAVFRTTLTAVLYALRVEHAAQDVIADARKVLHAAPAYHDHRVLLQIMTLAGDVSDDLIAVGEAHLCDLAERRIRLLRSRRV